MWILFALVAAVGAAGSSFALKRAVEHGGVIISTVAPRSVAAVLLLGLVAATGAWAPLTPEYWRAAGLVMIPEVLGTLFLTLALRAGDLSLVQPMLGLIPPLVMLGGIVVLGEVPTPGAAVGVAMVTVGIYLVQIQPGTGPLQPLRALFRSPASGYAAASALTWSVATLVHKFGIAAVGPFPWAVTLCVVSALGLAAVLPFVAQRDGGGIGLPERRRAWMGIVALGGLAFAVQQVGLHVSFRIAQASYVMAVTSTGTLLATVLGIVYLHERAAARTRSAGAALVTGGATLIALFG